MTGVRWDKLQEYLEVLVENDLMEITTDYEGRKCYKTTAKGKRYLDNLDQLKSMIDYKIEKTPLKF
jgi:predicted transcriptional regulator